ncbi:hypothetical protein [uncultured Microbacterium sp.]|uniref:hypothetical protein n=1 Tax=uncultured Microbacterium sp. TaxID=191216 RepID=UPI0028DBF2F8|nr:hypothetical protein [uncultured Microbacterium sp.]
MTYTLNGIPADNPDLGWYLTYDSQFVYSTTITRPEVLVPGYDGAIEMDGVENVPGVTLVWSINESQLPGLRNVLRSESLILGKGQGTASVSLRSFEPTKVGMGANPEYEVRAELVISGVWLRGAETSETTTIASNTQTVNVLTGSDGKVSDGALVLHGPFAAGVRVQDVAGLSWIRYTSAVPVDASIRYELATGRAFQVADGGNAFTGGTEVTPSLETGPDIFYLRLTPVISAANPLVAQPKLRVTSMGRGESSALTLRARPAYVL